MKKCFTTGQVAKMCHVTPRTVSKWFDTGRIKGYVIPGGRDRRIPREDLVRFLHEYGIHVSEMDVEEVYHILIVGADELLVGRLGELMPEEDSIKYGIVDSAFDAGIMMECFHPDTIIIDLAMGRSEAIHIVRTIRRNQRYERVSVIGLACEDELELHLFASLGFSDMFKRPFDVCDIVAAIRSRI